MSAPATFPYLASLFEPVDQETSAQVVPLPDDWSFPSLREIAADVVIVGHMPARGRPTLRTVARAIRREVMLLRLRLRPPVGRRLTYVERLPPVHRPGRLRQAIRTSTMSGLVIELSTQAAGTRLIEAICTAAGGRRVGRLRPSGDGSTVATLRRPVGDTVQLRVVPRGHPDDVSHGRSALLALEAAGVAHVPRPIAAGAIAGAAWTTESFIPGRHIPRLTGGLIDELVDLCARFPRGGPEDDALEAHVSTAVRMRPGDADALRRIHEAARHWAGPDRVLVHGDLWLHNVLVADGRLAGVIDWEMWHPRGLPGIDLLWLLAAEKRTVSGRDVGDLLVGDYWRSTAVRAVLERYFARRGEPPPGPDRLAAIAIAWWASRLAFADGRIDQPARDPAWAARNIDAPIAYLDRLVAERG